jgi:PKD repeat protein
MKKLLNFFFIFCVTLTNSQNLASGLQACYPLDNNAQNYAPTGASLNGTLVNVSAAPGHTGALNTAYSVNGTTGSYIVLPDHPGLKSDSVFFSGWFRIDSLPNPLQYLVYTYNGCNSNFEAYSLHTQYDNVGGHQAFCVTKSDNTCSYSKPQIFSSVTPVVGNWYHVCFYITNSVMKLWVDGVLQSSLNHNMPFSYQAGYNVFLGVTNQMNFDPPFKGAVDNVRFYKRELTQQEITLLYTRDAACDASPPVSAFSGPKTPVCPGINIPFTDQSTNSPTSWSWLFPGGNPGSSQLTNPVVNYASPGVYTVTLVASNAAGASNTTVKTITVNNCVSISENLIPGSDMHFYPNPATRRVYVDGLGEHTLIACDLLGKPVKYFLSRTNENVCEINFQEPVPGIYFIKVIDAAGTCQRNIKMILIE